MGLTRPLPAYVLAGGASRRMGEDKARAMVFGRPMALRVADALAGAGASPVTLVAKSAALSDLGLPVLVEPERALHPLYGVAVALVHAQGLGADHAVLSPCDLLYLDVAAVVQLLEHGGPCVASTAPARGDLDPPRRHPLLAVLPVHMADALRAAAEAGDSVHAALADVPGVPLPRHVLRNANRPADLP